MPAIGYVTKQANGGYKGQLKTLGIRAEIEIVPNTSKDPASNQPDFRVLLDKKPAPTRLIGASRARSRASFGGFTRADWRRC
jgi:uncharacterized protein (DUF736 family)